MEQQPDWEERVAKALGEALQQYSYGCVRTLWEGLPAAHQDYLRGRARETVRAMWLAAIDSALGGATPDA